MTVQKEYLSTEDLGDTTELRGFIKSSKNEKYKRDVREEIKDLESKAKSQGKDWVKINLDSNKTCMEKVVLGILDDLNYQHVSISGGHIQAEKKL